VVEPWEYVRSIEWAIAVWVVSFAAVVALTVRAVRRLRPISWGCLARKEGGAAYSVSYVMALPIYILLCCAIIETSLILMAKIGSVNAAYAAARNNVVYRSLDDAEQADSPPRARAAAVRAMAPFGSADPLHARPAIAADGRAADEYVAAARRYAPDLTYSDAAHRRGYLYANHATDVKLKKLGAGANDLVEAEVTYRVPIRMPGVGRLFGAAAPGGKYYFAEVQSLVRLPDESPQTPDGKLGIPYPPPP